VNIGQKYAKKEGQALRNLMRKIPEFDVVEHAGSLIGPLEDEKSGIIPNRNAELILSAAQYGERIYFGVIKDEINSDKSLEFIKAMEDVLNISNRKQYWTEGKTFKILTPTKEYNKTELIKIYLEKGGLVEHLELTVSCYSDTEHHCGDCPSCFKRWIAFKNNDIPFATIDDPMDFAHKHGIIEKCKDGTYADGRANEIITALKK
jgi:7-cyano-7-deazaguanine synthase in queuosine biosynthesis